jgi:hypothetical protein
MPHVQLIAQLSGFLRDELERESRAKHTDDGPVGSSATAWS